MSEICNKVFLKVALLVSRQISLTVDDLPLFILSRKLCISKPYQSLR